MTRWRTLIARLRERMQRPSETTPTPRLWRPSIPPPPPSYLRGDIRNSIAWRALIGGPRRRY